MKTTIKKLIKFFWNYKIEGEYRVFTLKHTGLCVKLSLTKKTSRKYGALPIDSKKIVFDNYMGKSYGCNTKYVTEALRKRRSDLDIVWIVKEPKLHQKEFPEGIRLVEYGSPAAMEEYMTAKVWVCNYHLNAYINKGLFKKAGQTYIQMWHGSLGIKRLERDCQTLTAMPGWMGLAKLNSHMTDIWISNSDFETEVYRRAFWNVDKIAMLGHPRNDIFFLEDMMPVRRKVFQHLGLHIENRFVLYVPTFRESGDFPKDRIHGKQLLAAFCKRFSGEWSLGVRLHPRMQGDASSVLACEGVDVISADAYPDIQELLAAADAVITDYSSCIFDFMMTKKPGFIYAPDIDAYNDERGFYYRLEETPFPVADNMDKLLRNIAEFDTEAYAAAVFAFIKGKGCIDDGHAAERVCDLIESVLGSSHAKFEG